MLEIILKILASAILIVNIGCFHNQHEVFYEQSEDIEGKNIIIFVPGYKGSTLVNNRDEVVWLSANEILFGESSVTIDNEFELTARDLLKKVKILPHLYEIDIYEECLERLENRLSKEEKLILFPYDWRKSNIETSETLLKFLDNLSKQKPKSISIISHSMGGLSVAYLLANSQIDYLDKAVFLGTPFRGTLKAFLDMSRPIEPILFNYRLFNRDSFISFGSAFELFPHPDDSSFYDSNLKNRDIIYNSKNWKDFRWGIYQTDLNADQKSLDITLRNTLLFYNTLDNSETTCPTTRILNLTGSKLSVLSEASFNRMKVRPLPSNASHSYLNQEGDILVSLKSAELPISLRQCKHTEEIIPEIIHDRFCNYDNVINRIFDFLLSDK